jgi:hypothetical protein
VFQGEFSGIYGSGRGGGRKKETIGQSQVRVGWCLISLGPSLNECHVGMQNLTE